MRIATWNINSVRARIERLVAWLERSDVDVLAIQETKVPDESFPAERIEGLRAHAGAADHESGLAICIDVNILN